MSFAATTLDRMAEKVTLEMLAANIEDLGMIIRGGFDYNEKQFQAISDEFRLLKDRLTRVEHAVYQIQVDLIAIDEEIRGIHKVIDGINVRVFALENRMGMTPLF